MSLVTVTDCVYTDMDRKALLEHLRSNAQKALSRWKSRQLEAELEAEQAQLDIYLFDGLINELEVQA